ncbi:MAG: ArsR family transcriptional regulator [Deltaproteobacteria bacterium]|nr:ArsR family transcriptional regulator [Deltaproteobacteria bacterium]
MPSTAPLKAVVTEKPSASLEEAIETFIQGAGQVSAALLGMINKVGGQMYALLYLSEEPLSLDDIAEKLAVSKSNVSINIRLLEDYDLVRKVWVKGSRKDFYSAERNYPKKVIKDFLENIRRTLTDALTTIERTRLKIDRVKLEMRKGETQQADFMLDQLGRIALFYEAAHQYFEDFFSGKPVDIELLRQAVSTSKE